MTRFTKCADNLLIQHPICCVAFAAQHTGLSDDNSEREPPDSIPNSAVKPLSADGSVGSPHVRVGHRQAS